MSAYVYAIISSYEETATREVVDQSLHERVDIDIALRRLVETGELSRSDVAVLVCTSLGHTPTSGGKELGISRWKFKRQLSKACKAIADTLGWEYSDERLLKTVKGKFNPSEKELRDLRMLLARSYNG